MIGDSFLKVLGFGVHHQNKLYFFAALRRHPCLLFCSRLTLLSTDTRLTRCEEHEPTSHERWKMTKRWGPVSMRTHSQPCAHSDSGRNRKIAMIPYVKIFSTERLNRFLPFPRGLNVRKWACFKTRQISAEYKEELLTHYDEETLGWILLWSVEVKSLSQRH